jgi:hypothetical protein
MPATVQLEHLQGSGPTAVPVVAVRFRSDDTSGVDTGAPITLPADVEASLPAITGSVIAQDVAITPLTPTGFGANDYGVVEPGTSRQEVVLITGVPGAGQISAVFRRSHPAGSLMMKVVASYSKALRVNLVTKPDHSLSNVRFARTQPLPAGIFDQFQVVSSYTPAAAIPWASDGTQVYAPVPTDPTLIYGTPLTAAGPVPNLVMIQWLYTARPVPAGITDEDQIQKYLLLTPTSYRFAWDES